MEPIYSRVQIARMAEEAAAEFARTGKRPENPFGMFSDAALAWAASLERALHQQSATEEMDGSA